MNNLDGWTRFLIAVLAIGGWALSIVALAVIASLKGKSSVKADAHNPIDKHLEQHIIGLRTALKDAGDDEERKYIEYLIAECEAQKGTGNFDPECGPYVVD